MVGENTRLALGFCLVLGMTAGDLFAVSCKVFRQKGTECTLLDTQYYRMSHDVCENDAAAKDLYGCVSATLNVPERTPGFDVDENGEQIDLDEVAAPGAKETWQCYGCPFRQPSTQRAGGEEQE